MLTAVVLAVASPSVTPKVPKDGEGVKSGPIGLAVILVLCVAVYFLFKSMSKHLKRVRDDFPKDDPPAREIPATPEDSAQPAEPVPSEVSAAESPPKPDSA